MANDIGYLLIMRFRDIIICLGCIVLAIVLLTVAGMQLDSINQQREEMNLIIEKPENVPPSLIFATVATGAFRGLVVDVLWMRADRLKEEGQYFDANLLAELITTLQPRFAAVWEFHAWNMAYNISVAIPASQPDQRWHWVKKGYELLRDKAIGKMKLKNMSIYRELARIFQHKIGSVSDDAHKYYKLQLATAMEPLLGPADNEEFEALAKAPRQWDQIISDANVAEFIEALKGADSAFTNAKGGEFVRNYLSLRQNSSRFAQAAREVINDFRGKKALEKFDIFARAYQLRDAWKLEPVLMQELNQTFGPYDFSDPNRRLPLDWRHPDCHAMYWAVKGLKIAAQEEGRKIEMIETNTDRIVGHCLQDLFRNGKIFIYDLSVEVQTQDASQGTQTKILKEIFLRPDLRMFKPYHEAFLAILKKYQATDMKTSLESLQNGHRNMLKNAVFSFYQAGHKDQAQRIYDELGTLYPLEEFKVPLVNFARKRFLEELDNIGINDAKEQVVFLLRESYYLYAIHDDDEAYGREKMAEEIYKYYQSKYLDENRIDLPDFKLLRYAALRDFLEDWQYPPDLRLSLLIRIEIEWPRVAEQLKQWKEPLEQIREQLRQQKEEMLKSLL